MTANNAPPVSALVASTVSVSVPSVSCSAVSESTGNLSISPIDRVLVECQDGYQIWLVANVPPTSLS